MGFLEVITGKRKLAGPAPDRLFAITTAYVLFETQLGLKSRGTAAIVFQPLATVDFESIVRDMEEVVRGTAADSGTTVESSDDPYGFRWLVLRGKEFDDLGRRHQCRQRRPRGGGLRPSASCGAVFAFEDNRDRALYWIYNYKRGNVLSLRPGAGRAGNATTSTSCDWKARWARSCPPSKSFERWFPLWGIPI